MTYIDAQTLLSEDQAVTADAASTNVYDAGANVKLGMATQAKILCQVTEAFNNLTSVKVTIQADTAENFSGAVELASVTVPLASLVAGYKLPIQNIPIGGNYRYYRAYYDVTGTTPTTGKFYTAIVPDIENWSAVADGI